MRRLWYICLALVFGLMMAVLPVVGQQPVTTEEAQPVAPAVVQVTPVTPEGEVAPSEATATPAIGPEIPVLLSARSDLELLAGTVLPQGRPIGWTGATNPADPQLALLTRLDLELLAGGVLGADQRPDGWFGAVPSTAYAIARDIRHDLELLADQALGAGVRPPGWLGGDAIMKCSRATQALVSFLERALEGAPVQFTLQADPNSADFCRQAETQAAQFAEVNLLSDASSRGAGLLAGQGLPGSVTINSNFAIAFLDRGAALRVGIVPNGTAVTPVARSYAEFSNMMLVKGPDFQVFLDYQFTTITPEEFKALPDVASTADTETNCAAEWCLAG